VPSELLVRAFDNQVIGGIERARRGRWHNSPVNHGDTPLCLCELPTAAVLAHEAGAMKAILAPGPGCGELERPLVARNAISSANCSRTLPAPAPAIPDPQDSFLCSVNQGKHSPFIENACLLWPVAPRSDAKFANFPVISLLLGKWVLRPVRHGLQPPPFSLLSSDIYSQSQGGENSIFPDLAQQPTVSCCSERMRN
jgi:hypothetical protein